MREYAETKWAVGERVAATQQITEDNFGGEHVWVHAEEGDKGMIDYVDEKGHPTVRFDKTGTATVVFDEEIKSLGMWLCSKCKQPVVNEGIYWVEDEIWEKANNGERRGIMHIRCVQEAIGRPLRLDDFHNLSVLLQFGYEMAEHEFMSAIQEALWVLDRSVVSDHFDEETKEAVTRRRSAITTRLAKLQRDRSKRRLALTNKAKIPHGD